MPALLHTVHKTHCNQPCLEKPAIQATELVATLFKENTRFLQTNICVIFLKTHRISLWCRVSMQSSQGLCLQALLPFTPVTTSNCWVSEPTALQGSRSWGDIVSPLQLLPHAAHAASHTGQQSSLPLSQPHPICSGSAPKFSFALHEIPGAGKGRLELLSEAQPHLVLFSVFTHNDYNLVCTQEDDKPQKQQFNLVKSKQIL